MSQEIESGIIEYPKSSDLNGVIAIYDNSIEWYKNNKDKELQGPYPVTKETIHLLKKFSSSKKTDYNLYNEYNFKTIIPENILYLKTDVRHIVWICKAAKRKLYFSKGCAVKTGEYPVPDLIFKLNRNQLTVWAVKTIKKERVLCMAPFYNTSSSGSVCMGNVKFISKTNDYATIIKSCESGFFNSYFTHSSSSHLEKIEYNKYMNSIKDSNVKFDPEKLIKLNQKIESICQ